jgi:hypothetical protein
MKVHALLKGVKNGNHVKGRLTNFYVGDVLDVFREEETCRRNARTDRRGEIKHYFSAAAFTNKNKLTISDLPSVISDNPNVIQRCKLHLVILVQRTLGECGHYVYVVADFLTHELQYRDPNKYELRNRERGVYIMDVVAKHINKARSGSNHNKHKAIAFSKRSYCRTVPRQNNDIDCGVFCLYYTDCLRNKYKIKMDLSDTEIYKSRQRLYSLKPQTAEST